MMAPASARAKVYNSDGTEATDVNWDNVVWSSPDSSRFAVQGDGDLIGEYISINAYEQGIYNFTAVYTYQVEENGEMVDKTATGSATVLVVTRGRIDPGNNSADVKAGYIFATNTGTDTLSQADFWITQENGINYINAPGGVSLLLNVENDIDGLTNWRILGSVLKVPDGLTYTTKTPCIWYGTFAIKDRNGSGYTKVTSFLGPDSSIAWPTAFIYVHSSNNTFQITY
jgi:hypothetical protein